MSSLVPWLVGLFVVALTVLGLWLALSRARPVAEDPYPRALEAWLDGDLDRAEGLLRSAVQLDPDSVEPFLHLGELLRQRGDAARAAVLHRGLTVRPDLPRGRRIDIGLALAEDLLELERWHDASATLDSIANEAAARPRFWWARFRQAWGRGDLPEAARSLKRSLRRVPEQDRAELEAGYIAFQLDRALGHALEGDEGAMSPRLKDVARFPAAAARSALVRAMAAAARGDATGALTLGADHLLDNPRELAVLLPHLQDVLLRSGHYARTIPLLENACRAENAPASLVVDLALLYEKLDRRSETLRLAASRSGAPDFTPDAAAPLLKLLVAESGSADLKAVWSHLSRPRRGTGFRCGKCGRGDDRMRWFCPACRAFDSYEIRTAPQEVRS